MILARGKGGGIAGFSNTVKPVMKEYVFVLFYQERLICDLYLQGGLYSEVAFNTGLTVIFHSMG